MKKKDKEILDRLPCGKWFACGSIGQGLGIHQSQLTRLVKLGFLKRRLAPFGLCRKWDYYKDF